MKSLNINYIDRIDHLRFFAAVMLIIHHFRGNLNWDGSYSLNAFARLWMENASSGVSFFLVLTGFLFCLISDSGRRRIKYSGYVFNRILRIFPLLVFLVFIIICCSRQVSSPIDILRVLTLQLNTGNGYTGWGHDFFPSGPIWTIAVEFQFYLIFPFLALFLKNYGPKYLVGVVILMLCTRFNISVIKGGDIYYNMYHTIIGRLDQFAIGMLFGHFYRKGFFAFMSKLVPNIFVFSISLAILTFMFTFHKTSISYCSLSFLIEAVCWGAIAICYLTAPLPDIKIINTSLSYLGMIIFSLYLLHLPLGEMINNVFSFSIPSTVSGSLYQSFVRIPLIVAASFFTFYIIEKPFMALRVKYLMN